MFQVNPRQRIHMKYLALLSLKDKSKKLKCLLQILFGALRVNYQRRKQVKFADSVELDKVAHNEPPHLDVHCLPSSL